jgi:hypothetical protein
VGPGAGLDTKAKRNIPAQTEEVQPAKMIKLLLTMTVSTNTLPLAIEEFICTDHSSVYMYQHWLSEVSRGFSHSLQIYGGYTSISATNGVFQFLTYHGSVSFEATLLLQLKHHR